MKISVKMKDGKAIINKIEEHAGGCISSRIIAINEGEIACIDIASTVCISGKKTRETQM